MRLALLLLCMLLPVTAGAVEKTVHVEWEYGGVATSYRLYLDGRLVGESFDKDNLVMEAVVDVQEGNNTFTMTAVGPYGETQHSAPFVLVSGPESVAPALVIKSVTILR